MPVHGRRFGTCLPVPLVLNFGSPGRHRAERKEHRQYRAAGQPDLLLTSSQPLADRHRDRQRQQHRGAVEPVKELVRPLAGRDQYQPDRNLHRDQRDRHAEIETQDREHPRAEQADDSGARAHRGYDSQYETVPIVDQHAAYRIRQVGHLSGGRRRP
jgi:hypothetical protein